MKKITALLGICLASLGIESSSANLIINGNFDSGNTGFSSDYTYANPNTDGGQYSVVSGPASNWNPGFNGSVVGYGGSGNYFIGNGSDNTTLAPWIQTISSPSVTLTTDINNPVYYRFEAQVVNAESYPEPNLSFEISVNGAAYKKFTSTPALSPGAWTLVYADTYLTSAPSSLSFRLRNQSSALGGNDFAIDSIYFGLSTDAPSYPAAGILSAGDIVNPTPVGPSTVPEPGQVAASILLLAGIGGYVWMKRRKAAKHAVTAA